MCWRIASGQEAHQPLAVWCRRFAARAHAEALTRSLRQCSAMPGMTLADVDAIAATAGPGLMVALWSVW